MRSVPWFWVVALIPVLVLLVGWRSGWSVLGSFVYLTALIYFRLGSGAVLLWLGIWVYGIYRVLKLVIGVKAKRMAQGVAG